MGRQIAASLVLALLCGACGTEGGPANRVTVVDSAGVTIVDNGVLDTARSLLVSPAPKLQIGVVEGDERLQLFQVADVKRLSDGAIAVANGGSRDVRIYSADGQHRATVGGPGRGPSEFRYPGALIILAGDTIQVQDFMDRVYFTAAGEFIRRETLDQGAFAALWAKGGGFSEGGRWMADGTFFAPVYERSQGPPIAGPLYRPRMTFVRVSAGLGAVDTLGPFGGILQQYIDTGGGEHRSTVPPFATNTSWALGASDGTVVAGDNAAPQVDRFLPDGSHMIVRWVAPSEPVSSSEVEEWKQRQRKADWTQRQLPALERAWAVMDVPERKPYYGQIGAGSDGTIWLGPAEGPGDVTSLKAFGPDGRFRGAITVPGRFTPYDSGPGWILGILTDDNGVEFAQLFELDNR
jgi:hypothetical protein